MPCGNLFCPRGSGRRACVGCTSGLELLCLPCWLLCLQRWQLHLQPVRRWSVSHVPCAIVTHVRARAPTPTPTPTPNSACTQSTQLGLLWDTPPCTQHKQNQIRHLPHRQASQSEIAWALNLQWGRAGCRVRAAGTLLLSFPPLSFRLHIHPSPHTRAHLYAVRTRRRQRRR